MTTLTKITIAILMSLLLFSCNFDINLNSGVTGNGNVSTQDRKLPENFNSPYKATNIIEFWRRWHMTLSRFLRDYLYIPLAGNRHGTTRTRKVSRPICRAVLPPRLPPEYRDVCRARLRPRSRIYFHRRR